MPDFFQINLEQMLSELRLHESNTQALFNALEGEKLSLITGSVTRTVSRNMRSSVKATLLLW